MISAFFDVIQVVTRSLNLSPVHSFEIETSEIVEIPGIVHSAENEVVTIDYEGWMTFPIWNSVFSLQIWPLIFPRIIQPKSVQTDQIYPLKRIIGVKFLLIVASEHQKSFEFLAPRQTRLIDIISWTDPFGFHFLPFLIVNVKNVHFIGWIVRLPSVKVNFAVVSDHRGSLAIIWFSGFEV